MLMQNAFFAVLQNVHALLRNSSFTNRAPHTGLEGHDEHTR